MTYSFESPKVFDKLLIPEDSVLRRVVSKLRVEEIARRIAEFCGFSQSMTYSFESPKVFDKLLIPEDSVLRRVVSISNPLGEDFSVMRTTPLNGMLNSLSTNYNRRNKDVKLYELATIYLPVSEEENAKHLEETGLPALPDERQQFTLGMYGNGDFFTMKGVVEEFLEKVGMKKKPHYNPEAGKSFLHPGRQALISYNGNGDFFTMKGVVEEFLEKVGMKKKPHYNPEAGKSFLHPGRQALISYNSTVIGYMGEVHPDVADNYKLGEKTYVAVLDMPEITANATFDHKYEGIAKYPSVTRDLSMVMKKEILAGQIEDIIEQRGGKILESYQLFDVYEGSQITAGYKSVAYSITFRSKDHTLEEKEVTSAMNKILNGLQGLGIELRS